MKHLFRFPVTFGMIMTLAIMATSNLSAQEPPSKNVSSLQKKYVFVSTTFSLSHSEGRNESTLLQQLDDSYRLQWDITLRSGYFIKDYFALGGLFKYASEKNLTSYTTDNMPVNDNKMGRSYTIAPFMRNYLPLGNGRFCLFNETNLGFTYGSSIQQIEDVNDVDRIESYSYELKLGMQPGITAFVNDLVSVEIGTSLLGLSTKHTASTTNGDQDNKTYTFSNDVDFKINLLALFLGITFYFPS